jgi:hypothetical protein
MYLCSKVDEKLAFVKSCPKIMNLVLCTPSTEVAMANASNRDTNNAIKKSTDNRYI